MTTSIDEIVVYESPDGGRTVYARSSKNGERNLVKQEPVNYMARWYVWKDILYLAQTDITLNELITKAEMIYALKK